MARRLPHRLVKVVILGVDGVLVGLRGLRDKLRLRHGDDAQPLAERSVVGDGLRDNVARPGESVVRRRDVLVRVHKARRLSERIHAGLLREEKLRERLQSALPRDGGAGAALRAVRTVHVVELGEGGGRVKGGGHLGGEGSGRVDQAAHLLAPLLEAAQVLEALRELAERLVVEAAVRLLAVAGDKGDGVSLVDELDHLLCLPGLQGELIGKRLGEIHLVPPSGTSIS